MMTSLPSVPKVLRLFFSLLLALVLSGSVAHGTPFAEEISQNCSFSPTDSAIFGYRISQNEVLSVCTTTGTAMALPNQLVIGPGKYLLSFPEKNGEVFSRVISAIKPGVYKFIVPGLGSRQFVVWWPRLGVTRLLTDFGYMYVHGNRDDELHLEALATVGTTRNISVTCGTISNLLRNVLNKFRIKSRIVVSRTLDRPNGLDDGHIMLEIREGKSWALFDPDSRSFFGTKSRKLGVADIPIGFVPLVGKNIQLYGPLMMVDVGGFVNTNGDDLSFLEQRSRVSSASLTTWYTRVLGVVGVEINGTYYFNKNVDNKLMQTLRDQYGSIKFVSTSFFRK